MCEAFPHRREELDKYGDMIINIHDTYGSCFYEYHKLFLIKNANALWLFGIKIYWYIQDRDLLQYVMTAGAGQLYQICGELSHATRFCPLAAQSANMQGLSRGGQARGDKNFCNPDHSVDKYIRQWVIHNDKEICNNSYYNVVHGCRSASCERLHLCKCCKSSEHPVISYPQNSNHGDVSKPLGKQNREAPANKWPYLVHSPVNITQLTKELDGHQNLVQHLLDVSCSALRPPTVFKECKNLQSALKDTDAINNLIQDDLNIGFLSVFSLLVCIEFHHRHCSREIFV